jgi:methylated-DNA-[protein]-cysteine S-methyltransferase
MDTPVGPVVVAWKGEAIVAIQMKETKNRMGWSKRDKATSPEKRLLADLKSRFHDADVERSEEPRGPAKKLARYFAGSVHAIDDLPVDPGGTPFQAKIWKRLCEIPTGETMTYGELAASVGHPDGARAAGGAVGSNPIPIVIPCHRIIAANGTLNGFGGGLQRKRWLLRHEGAAFRDDSPKLLQLALPPPDATRVGSGSG